MILLICMDRLAPFFYHQKQNDNISELAIDNMEDTTLRSQVAYWLNHILGTTVKTENIQDNIIVAYQAPHDVASILSTKHWLWNKYGVSYTDCLLNCQNW